MELFGTPAENSRLLVTIQRRAMTKLYLLAFLALGTIAVSPIAVSDDGADKPFREWSLSKAVKLLNSSAWARQETYTTVVGGVGSGRSGEKEIYNRFYIRFLSAQPIREAYARVQQIQHGYDELEDGDKQRFDDVLKPGLEMDVDRWIVVAVSFRSNDPNLESQVRRFFQTQTTETLKDKVFLSTEQLSQVKVDTYFPPREEGVGAKFVFPRIVDGIEVASEMTGSLSFELLDVPISRPRSSRGDRGRGRGGSSSGNGGGSTPLIIRSTFSVEDMVIDGKLIL